LDRKAGQGQPGWVSVVSTENTGLPGHDSSVRRALEKGVWAEQLGQQGQEREDGKAGTGRQGQDNRGRTAGIGQLGHASLDRIARTEKPGQDS
jgi:hypothetical protein